MYQINGNWCRPLWYSLARHKPPVGSGGGGRNIKVSGRDPLNRQSRLVEIRCYYGQKPGRGGRRQGAGRKPKNRAALPDLDIQHALAEPAPEDIEAAARRHAVMAIGTMVKIVTHGESESAAIRAANAILDRGLWQAGR
jgi:hypothetical protein